MTNGMRSYLSWFNINNLPLQPYQGIVRNKLKKVHGKQSTAKHVYTKYQPTKQQFKIHIAIDFGTDGCALAYYYKDKVIVYNKWKTKKSQRAIKAKSQILLNEYNDVVAFGDNAKIIYAGLIGDEKTNWKFFDRFKMSLSIEGDEPNDHQTVYVHELAKKKSTKKTKNKIFLNGFSACLNASDDIDDIKHEMKLKRMSKYHDHGQCRRRQSTYLKSLNNNKCSADIVFISALKRLQKTAYEYMAKITNSEKISNDEIQWIVTIPAIWSEKAKSKMKQWTIKAGLVNPDIKDQCLLVYEADCAAFSMFEQIKQESLKINKQMYEQKDNHKCTFKHNKYILIDAGGGTVDICCHKIVSAEGVEEIHCPTGYHYGAAYIDDEYIKLLEELFSKEWIDEFKIHSPNVYLEILDCFQVAKIKFYKKQNIKTHSVELPYEFVQYLHKKLSYIDASLDTILQNWRYKDTVSIVDGVEDTMTTLQMDIEVWKELFDKIIDKIMKRVENLLSVTSIGQVHFLCLVGGFSSSKYFQFKMKERFGMESKYQLNIIIPKKPSLSVVMGAALYGGRNNFIQARIMRYTYGVNAHLCAKTARKNGISEHYIKKNTNQDGNVENCFQIIIRKGDCVRINDPIGHEFIYDPVGVNIILLCSEFSDPKTRQHGKEIATLRMKRVGKCSNLIIEYHFHGTMFSVYVYSVNNPEYKEEIQNSYRMF